MGIKKEVIEKKTNTELLKYLEEDSKYMAEAIQTAFEILNTRGVEFSIEEQKRVKELIIRKEDLEKTELGSGFYDRNGFVSSGERIPSNAPLLYSQLSIYLFCLLFETLAGAILMALNYYFLKKKKIIIIAVVFFGLFFYVLKLVISYFLLNYYDGSVPLSLRFGLILILSSVGAIVIHHLFWKKYIQDGLIYQKRNTLIPLGIFFLLQIAFWYLGNVLSELSV